LDPEEEGSEFLLNLGACVTNYMMSEFTHSTEHYAIRREVTADTGTVPSSRSLYYDRSIASSKWSSPHSVI